MIDTHCHLTYDGLFEQVDQVIDRAASAGVDRMITVGTFPDDATRAIELTQRYDNVFATAGLHPHYADKWPDRDALIDRIREFALMPKVVALGEMGLDNHYPDPPIEDQRRALEWQLELASEISHLPIVIHNREATDQTLTMLRASGIPGERFVFHCFTGDVAEFEKILEFGAMISFTGVVTFKNSKAIAECAARMPDDRLMIETDSPYLTPEPHRKVRPNEPCYVACVAKFIAEQRGEDEQAFVAKVDANAERFFGL